MSMIRPKNENGSSASIIIIAILFLALMATLGVVFYQNFIQKKPVATSNESSNSAQTMPILKTARVAFNNMIYAVDYPDKGWEAVPTPGTGSSVMIAKNTAGTVKVSINLSQTTETTSCNPNDGLQIGSYSVSGATAKQLTGSSLYLVAAIYDHAGGGYDYKIGLAPDSGNTHSSVGATHCDVSTANVTSQAVWKGQTLTQPAIETSITFPKLAQSPAASAKDMQTIKDLMNTDDYKAAVKILESARKE
jgi:hypothetical protein